jgi:hypothetical protein
MAECPHTRRVITVPWRRWPGFRMNPGRASRGAALSGIPNTIGPTRLAHHDWPNTIGPTRLARHDWPDTTGPTRLARQDWPISRRDINRQCGRGPFGDVQPASVARRVVRHRAPFQLQHDRNVMTLALGAPLRLVPSPPRWQVGLHDLSARNSSLVHVQPVCRGRLATR